MVVVPAMVVGAHETLGRLLDEGESPPAATPAARSRRPAEMAKTSTRIMKMKMLPCCAIQKPKGMPPKLILLSGSASRMLIT